MAPARRDIVVIGGSAGSLEPLKQLLGELPADFPAAIFVVVHTGPLSYLPQILDGVSALPVKRAESGKPITPGEVQVAAPGCHLLLHDGHVLLRRGPRENAARPAIDPLFRSAAASQGGRVIGIVLSGALNDGAAGLRAIKRCAGIAIVQDPADAAVPDMPRAAQRHAEIDHCVAVAAMAGLLQDLVRERAPPSPPVPLDIRLETAIAAQETMGMQNTEQLGEISPFTCPECNGALWEINDGSLTRYRCHVGHAFTSDTMLASQGEEIAALLENLLRAHRARAALVRRMAAKERQYQRGRLAAQLEARGDEYEEAAAVVRRMIDSAGLNGAPEEPPPA